MNIDELRIALSSFLEPLLSATVLEDPVPCKATSMHVASLDPSRIAIKSETDDKIRLVLYRKVAFTPDERELTKHFVAELLEMHAAASPDYRNDLFTFLPVRAISRYLGGLDAVNRILRQFETWSTQTYEGGSITSSIGIDPHANGSGTSLADFFEHDFSAVVSNGFDTLLVVTPSSEISNSGQLSLNQLGLDYVPYRLNAIADWTDDSKVALVLNRLGEQLVFKNKRLVFAKRRGEWQYYAHELYLRRIQPPKNRVLREAIYQSCLDISFARSGGCIIVVKSGAYDEVHQIVSESDLLMGPAPSIKAKTIHAMVGGTFQDLDRRLRQELLSLDGAMVLDHNGSVVAAGAIISVPAGSQGGGRTAAARKGSSLGLGVKISEDGGISVYRDEELLFVV